MSFDGDHVVVIIPALDEQDSIGPVVAAIDRKIVDRVIVVDNGSLDKTSERAAEAGAYVLYEPRRGYGSACLRGIKAAADADILIFLDGDGSDDPRQIENMLKVMQTNQAELVIGSRVLGQTERGALTPLQRFGNALTCGLVRIFWNVRYTDLGPFRAIRRRTLEDLQMSDPDFGWTIEMQVKAAQAQIHTVEMPVNGRSRQAGRSKVSGTVLGSYRAGKTILGYLAKAKFEELSTRPRRWLGF